MNLIVNRYLDRSQEQAIYELTLKKQRSKKSTISQKQAQRMQQLASELMPQRKDLTDLINEFNATPADNRAGPNRGPPANNSRDFHDLCRCNSSATTNTNASQTNDNHSGTNELQRQSSTSTIATNSTSSSSSLQTSISSCCLQSSNYSTFANPGLEQETSIKINQMRLDHLNNELKRRLNQYEYLVAQEKAILGSNNKALITGEGVNNFHLHQLV